MAVESNCHKKEDSHVVKQVLLFRFLHAIALLLLVVQIDYVLFCPISTMRRKKKLATQHWIILVNVHWLNVILFNVVDVKFSIGPKHE